MKAEDLCDSAAQSLQYVQYVQSTVLYSTLLYSVYTCVQVQVLATMDLNW